MRLRRTLRHKARRAGLVSTLVASEFFQAHHRTFFPGTSFRSAVLLDHRGSVASGRSIERWKIALRRGRTSLRRDVFVNAGPPGSIRSSFATMRQIYRHVPNGRDLVAPRPLWISANGRRMAYEGVAGREVRALLESGRASSSTITSVVRGAARWLKRCHDLRPAAGVYHSLTIPARPSLPNITLAEWRLVRKTLGALQRSQRRSLLHGDPHLANIIQQGHDIGLIDYSETHVGSGWEDIARFRVHLDVALHPYFSARQIEKIVAAVLTGYIGGRGLRRLERQTLLAYQVVVLDHFYLFTKNLNPRARGYIGWILKRFMKRGLDDVRSLLAIT